MLDKRRHKLVFKAAVGDRGPSLIGEEFDANLGIAGRVTASGKAVIVPDVHDSNDFFRGIDAKSSFQTPYHHLIAELRLDWRAAHEALRVEDLEQRGEAV